MSLSIPFPVWVAAEQKGGRGLSRDSSPPLTFRVWYSHICAEKGH